MLDLKAKLAAAGLVSAADVAAAERKSSRGPTSPKGQDQKASSQAGPQSRSDAAAGPRPQGPQGQPRGQQGQPRGQQSGAPGRANASRNNQANKPARPAGLDVVALKRGGKGEAYDAIRRAVERGRLDPLRAIPGEHASAFHFTTATGQLSRLMLEPEAHAGLADGSAGIIAFMSHHGLAHCVVPRPLAEAVHEVFPLWLRVLHGHPGAGQQEAPRPPPTDTSREPPPTDANAEPDEASAPGETGETTGASEPADSEASDTSEANAPSERIEP